MIPGDRFVPWLGVLPDAWKIRPLKHVVRFNPDVLEEDTDPGRVIRYVDISTVDSQGRMGKPEEMTFFDAPSRARRVVQSGDVIVSTVRTYLTAISRIDADGLTVSTGFAVLRPRTNVDSRFLGYWMRSQYIVDEIVARSTGVSYPAVNPTEIGQLPFPMINADQQHVIADFLDRETTRIDLLVEDYRRLIELLNEEVASLALSSMDSATTLRLGNAATIVSRPVIQKEGELYTPIGLFNRGRGLFHKDPREKDDMGDSDFFWIEEADLVISGQFAWEGAIALAGKEDSGCVVSHRYYVLRGRDGATLTEYLLALLSTKHGDFLLNENSRGAAGRNRPLNINSLLKEKIPVPDLPAQEMVAKAVHRRIRVLSETSNQIGRLQAYRSALISAAVTGQIDVRKYRPQEAAALCQ